MHTDGFSPIPCCSRTRGRLLAALVACSLLAAAPFGHPQRSLQGVARAAQGRAAGVGTSVVGLARLADGTPLAGASVRTNLGLSGTSAPDGSFLLEGGVPAGAPLVVQVEGVLGGVRYACTSGALAPLPRGMTDAGELIANPGAFRPLFPEPQLYVAQNERSVASTDLDGDGDLDLAVVSFSGGGIVSVLRNDGTGSYGPAEEILTNSGPLWVSTGDLDDDGDVDLAVANTGGVALGTVSILLNEGDGTFAPPIAYTAARFQNTVLVADLDGDQDLDLVAGHSSPFSDELTLLRNAGDGTFGPPESLTVGDHRGFALFDAEGDGDPDLAVLLVPSGVLLLRNEGGGTFAPETTYPSLNRPERVLAADLDGDDDLDLAVASNDGYPTSASFEVFPNAGDGTFGAPVSYGPFAFVEELLADDLNGDGSVDLAVSSGNGGSYVLVFRNRGDGTFAPETRYTPGLGSFSLASGDADGDGDADLFVGSNDDRVKVLLNDHDRRFETHTALAADTPFDVSLADMDGDQDLDLVYASFTGDTVVVRPNDGKGGFLPEASYATRSAPRAVATDDLDGDGDLDVAVVNGEDDTLSVLANQGDGTLAAQLVYPATIDPLEVEAADLDGDGARDLTVTRSGSLAVLLNDGVGTFGAPASYSSGFGTRDLASGDLDLDGDLDLVVTNQNAGTALAAFSLLLNGGAGTFGPNVRIGSNGSLGVTLADVDQDGLLDIVGSGGGALVLRNLGGGTFATAVSYPTGASPRKILARDLDFDGDPDLAVATAFFGSTVSVLRNAGDGTFGASQYHGVSSAAGLACGDLDGDRDLELVTNSTTANAGLGSLSILWNRLRRKPQTIDGEQDPFSTDE